MAHHIELNPVSHFTIGTVGPPGQRTFYIQGRRGTQIISLVIEKEQARMLADSLDSLLDELRKRFPDDDSDAARDPVRDMRLHDPVESLFRVGNMGLGYDEDSDLVVLVAYELVDEDEEPNVVSYWVEREQIPNLVRHTRETVSAGRPICGNCGGPINADGHFCPQRNGHAI